MMIVPRSCAAAVLALIALAVITPVDAKLRGTAGNTTAKAKAKAASAIHDFHALIKTKAPWGLYDAAQWSAAEGKLREASGSGRDVVSEGTIKVGSGAGHGAKGDVAFIFGSPQSRLYWPEGSIPPHFTLCSITRYTGEKRERILHGKAGNWLHGHFLNGAGSVFYESWLTDHTPETGTKNWAVVCASNGLPAPTNVLYNGRAIGRSGGGSGNNVLAVNPTTPPYADQNSDFALSFVGIWDQHLTADEMKTVSDALLEYLATGRSLLTPVPEEATPASNTVTTVSGSSTATTTSLGPCNVTTTSIATDDTTATTTTIVSCPPETKA